MVIKLGSSPKIQAPTQLEQSKFKIKEVEWLFSDDGPRKNWNDYYEKNKHKLLNDKVDIYDWCVFPLLTKEDQFYRCILHPTVDVDAGNKEYTYFYKNIHFSEFLSHCLFYKPEEHKQYIIQKIFKVNNVNINTTG